jgi:SAM-dependent methyltransferase
LSRRDDAHREAERFFEEHWRKGDAWAFDSSPWEASRLDRLAAVVGDRRYPRVLELGCGAGHFTQRLLPLADSLLAVDISPTAIEKARSRLAASSLGARAELRVANVMELDLRAAGAFDLAVLTETVYYLGWLYPFFSVAWLARDLFETLAPGARLLLANTLGEIGDALVLPWIVKGYHEVFKSAGFETEREESLHGEKDGVKMEVLITLLRVPEGRA